MRHRCLIAGLLMVSMLGCAPSDEDETTEGHGAASSQSSLLPEGLYYSHRGPETIVLGLRGSGEDREARVWVGEQSTAWIRPQTSTFDLIALSTLRATEGLRLSATVSPVRSPSGSLLGNGWLQLNAGSRYYVGESERDIAGSVVPLDRQDVEGRWVTNRPDIDPPVTFEVSELSPVGARVAVITPSGGREHFQPGEGVGKTKMNGLTLQLTSRCATLDMIFVPRSGAPLVSGAAIPGKASASCRAPGGLPAPEIGDSVVPIVRAR